MVRKVMSRPAARRSCSSSASTVPAAVEDDVAGDGADQAVQRGRVGEGAGERAAGDAGEEGLLAGDAVEVAAGQVAALPDEGERVGAGHGLVAGGQVDARALLADGGVEADRDAADRLGDLHEPGQVDLGEVVDRHAGELLDGADELLAPGLALQPLGQPGRAVRGALIPRR
jgi:hypothetical protein